MKKTLITLLKLGIPACLFAYLLWRVPAADYTAFLEQRKRPELLLLAQVLAFLAIVLSILRWRILVLAFEIPFTVREALRLGFLGYLLNFVSFGSVGGDIFKAILAARDRPSKRPEAVASVLLDRAIGLLGLVILAWVTLAIGSQASGLTATMTYIRNAAGIVAGIGIGGLILAIFSGAWFDQLIETAARIPVVGETLGRMARAVRQLRRRPLAIFGLVIYSVGVHSLLATTVYLISCGVYAEHPTLGEHFMVVPPGMAAGALPLAPGGLGYQEGVLAELFSRLPDLPENYSGILVATIYRLATIMIAGIGLMYYLASHRDFRLVTQSQIELQRKQESVDAVGSEPEGH